MAHTHSQDLEARFTTLQSNFTETQQEVKQINVNIATINKNIHSSIIASIEELKEDLKQDITTQIESVTLMICTKLHILPDPLYLTHLFILKLKLPLIPIIFIPITFSVTYALCVWM
jgi:hypothetical protein